jgi:hypothetical protein
MPRLRGVTLAAALGAFVLATTACGGDDDEAAGDPSDRGSTTTTAASTTTVEAVGPPEWVDVVRDLQQRINQIETAPDPEQVGTAWSEDGPDYQAVVEETRRLQEAGQHYVREPKQVVFVRIETPDDVDNPRLTIRYTRPRWELVDEAGTVVDDFPGAEPGNCVSVALTHDGPDGSYRIWGETSLTGCPQEAG